MRREILGPFLDTDELFGILLLRLKSHRPQKRERLMRADEHVLFWEKKLVENRHILAMLDAGQFKAGDGGVLDAQTLAEVRKWAKRRIAECEARISARVNIGGEI